MTRRMTRQARIAQAQVQRALAESAAAAEATPPAAPERHTPDTCNHEWEQCVGGELCRACNLVRVPQESALSAEAELRIRLEERRAFQPLVQRIAEDAARRTLERIEEVADIVKRERPFLPPCVVEDIRDAAGWARETAEAERERAADESLSSMTRSVSRECAAKYDRLAKIAELHLEGRPQPAAVTDWTDAQVDAALDAYFVAGKLLPPAATSESRVFFCERMRAALRATQEGR